MFQASESSRGGGQTSVASAEYKSPSKGSRALLPLRNLNCRDGLLPMFVISAMDKDVHRIRITHCAKAQYLVCQMQEGKILVQCV